MSTFFFGGETLGSQNRKNTEKQSMAESAVSSVVRAFGNLAVQEAAFLRGVHADAELLKAELRRMQCFLKDADDKRRNGGDARVTNWVVEVRAAAYCAEDVLEEADLLARRRSLQVGFLGAIAWFADLITLHKIGVEISKIRTKIREISEGAAAYRIADLGETGGVQEVVIYGLYHDEGDSWVVGFDEERNKIVDELLDPANVQVCVISIVGMGGSGKSTLARKISNSVRVKQHFDAMAWVVLSQKFKFLDLLKDVAKRIMGITREKKLAREKKEGNGEETSGNAESSKRAELEEDSNRMTIEELEKMGQEEVLEMLHEFLEKRRYLVVLDDVWKGRAYGEINSVIGIFPEANNGSRVMITTRDLQVAKHADKRSIIHEKKLLDEKKSWELLEKKAFPEYRNVSSSDRSRLAPVGEKLASKCKGLPLALVVLGGYLSRNLDYDIWLGLVDNLDWEARKNEEPVWDILARSYYDLPNHQLRSCFLYATSFPEDHIISVSRLSKLWIAEGFVLQRHNRTLEETAREYMNELAQRCMVQVVERSKVYGSIKSFVIHDVLRDWGIEEARKEGFFNIWSKSTDPVTSSDAIPAYRVALHNFSSNELVVSMPKLRTLLVFSLLSKELCLCGLKFLKVLDLYGLKDIKNLPSEIGEMMHLRYLGLRKCGQGSVSIPSSIANLLNLQTLDARGANLRSLPQCFWDIPTLRHVYICEVHRWVSPEVGHLQSLQTLYICGICNLQDVNKYLISKYRRIARAENKGTRREYRKNWAAMVEALSEMEQLVFLHLESWRNIEGRRRRETVLSPRLIMLLSGHCHLRALELAGYHEGGFPVSCLSALPQNLRKLKLIGSALREDPMQVLGKLPNLVVLVLADDAYEGESMTCHADGFPRLQHLTCDRIRHVKTWNVEVGAFPALTHLVLEWSFDKMTIPPLGLVNVTSLQELQLMPRKYVSARNVKKFEERGCKVTIKEDY